MITLATKENYNKINELLSRDIFQNIYLYIDAQIYGYNAENVKTYVLEHNKDIKVILYHYYNSLQIFQCCEINNSDLNLICEHILEYKFSMISGNEKIISNIEKIIGEKYCITRGCVMSKKDMVLESSTITEIANIDDCQEIAELICSDTNIGGHYYVEELKEQLVDRMKNKNCINLVIRKDKIISHMGIYADCDSLSVLGGLITDKKYRSKGYGKILLNDLTRYVQQKNKIPVLYCYQNNIIEWYSCLGWKKVMDCAKLEKK